MRGESNPMLQKLSCQPLRYITESDLPKGKKKHLKSKNNLGSTGINSFPGGT